MVALHTAALPIVPGGRKIAIVWPKKGSKHLQLKNMAVLQAKNAKVIMQQTVALHPNQVVLEVRQNVLRLTHRTPAVAEEPLPVRAV